MSGPLSRLGESSLVYGIGLALNRFIGLLLLPLFTTYLSPEEYGVLGMLAVLSTVAQSIFGLGQGAAMGPSYFDGADARARARVVWSSFGLLLASAVVLLAGAWGAAEWIGALVLLRPEFSALVSLSLTGCALSILATPFMLALQFEERSMAFVTYTVVSAGATGVLGALMVAVAGWGAQGLVLSQLAGGAITLALFGGRVLGSGAPRWDWIVARRLLRAGIHLVPSFAFLFVLMHSSRYFLQWEHGLDSVGVFFVGASLGGVLGIVTSAISTAWFPFFMSYAARPAQAPELFGRVVLAYVLIVGFACLLFFVFAPTVIALIVDPRYADARVIVGPVSAGFFFLGVYNLMLPGVYLSDEVWAVSWVQGVALVLSLPLGYLLVNYLGLLGAGLGVATAHLVLVLAMYYWNRFRRERYVRAIYDWGRILRFMAGFCLIAVLSIVSPAGHVAFELLRAALLALFSAALLFACTDPDQRRAAAAYLKRAAG